MNRLVIIIWIVACTNILAQIRQAEFEIHRRGMLWETMKDDGTIGAPEPLDPFTFYPSMDWPGGPTELLLKDDQRSYMLGAGIWMGGFGSNGLFFTEHGPFQGVDEATYEGITRTENYLENPGYDPEEAEEIISTSFVTSQNIHVSRTSRAWSFPEMNSFIIIEYEFTNQTGDDVSDFYAGFPYLIRPSYQDIFAHNGWGDDQNRVDDLVRYDPNRKLLYAFDDTPDSVVLPYDIGNYVEALGELRTTGYAGFAIIDADPASDGLEQPSNVYYAQLLDNAIHFSLSTSTTANMYDILSGADRTLQATGADHLAPFMLMACGPYDLSAGGSVKIVVVEAVDGMPLEDAVEGLDNFDDLTDGRELLQANIDTARTIYEQGYHITTVPPPPPVMDVIPIPRDQTITVSWKGIDSLWTNPLSGRSNFKEYRVYRSERSFAGPWSREKVLRPGSPSHVLEYYNAEENEWVFTDDEISLGVSYYYAVTSMDSNDVESFRTNALVFPVKAANEAAEDALNISVFPNPFRRNSGFPLLQDQSSIVWTNLPAVCTIRIYTSSGELVRTIEHDNPDIGEEVWNQLNEARQFTAPGIYFWTVTSDVGNAKGTLLLIK